MAMNASQMREVQMLRRQRSGFGNSPGLGVREERTELDALADIDRAPGAGSPGRSWSAKSNNAENHTNAWGQPLQFGPSPPTFVVPQLTKRR
jgi:hypothetical protein